MSEATQQEDPMFTSRTDAELRRSYESMLTTAHDLGAAERGDVPTLGEVGESREALVEACQSLHDRIERFRAGIDHEDEGSAREEPAEQVTPVKKARAVTRKPRVDPAAGSSARPKKGEPAKDPEPPKQEKSTMAEAAVAETAKKTRTPRAPKAPAAPPPAAKRGRVAKAAPPQAHGKATDAARVPRARFTDDQKIVEVNKENPRKEGTEPHERYELLKKFKGKKVSAFIEAGGYRPALNRAVDEGYAKVQ